VSHNASVVAWCCFGLGAALVTGGVLLGLYLALKRAPADVRQKIRDAEHKVDQLRDTAVESAHMNVASTDEAEEAESQADDAKSILSDIGSIIGSLPENLRFAGLLILVGAALMSVATVQFGGHSIF
jgi:hypothetical protein